MGNIHKVSYNSVSSNGRIVLPRTPLPKLKASEMVSYKKWHVNQNLNVHRTELGDMERKGTGWTKTLKGVGSHCVPGITSCSVSLEHKL